MPLRPRALPAALLGLLALVGCQPAGRYGTPPVDTGKRPEAGKAAAVEIVWLNPLPTTWDVPLAYVDAASDPEGWDTLREYWNPPPKWPRGVPTVHFGMSPLGAVVGIAAADAAQAVKIKVPLGLPNPAPYIPATNPPTFNKWLLGKKLFHDPTLLGLAGGGSCAFCHRPERAFSVPGMIQAHPHMMDAPSLLNCVFNKHQFWDGRVTALEEVVFRDERERKVGRGLPGSDSPQYVHAWTGVVKKLQDRKEYVALFRLAFGVERPTQDAAAKALATYLRTLLSGDSLYDRADYAAARRGGKDFTAADFEGLLTEEALAGLGRKGQKKAEVAAELLAGYTLFRGRAGCARCHSGWNFTDGDFHNIGVRESDHFQRPGEENGRFAAVPVGLKEARLIGAFRTPSLRNLPRTPPYFHGPVRGVRPAVTLGEVVDYYDGGIDAEDNRYLAAPLLEAPGEARRLRLSNEDARALVLFLLALDGGPVPRVVAEPN